MKNKAKGILTLILVALLSLTLFACTGGGGTGNTSESSGESKGESVVESVVESESATQSAPESAPESEAESNVSTGDQIDVRIVVYDLLENPVVNESIKIKKGDTVNDLLNASSLNEFAKHNIVRIITENSDAVDLERDSVLSGNTTVFVYTDVYEGIATGVSAISITSLDASGNEIGTAMSFGVTKSEYTLEEFINENYPINYYLLIETSDGRFYRDGKLLDASDTVCVGDNLSFKANGAEEELKSGEIFIRVYLDLSAPYEEFIGIYGENMTLTEVFEYIAEESAITYAGEISLDTFAVYNAGMEIAEETYFEGWGNYLCIINREIISADQSFTVTYSGTDNYGNPIEGSFETGITYFENAFYMMGITGSFSDYYFTVYGGTVGAMGENEMEKADVWASMIFAPTEIVVHPLVLVTVQIEDYSYMEFRYSSAPTLLTVIQDMQMENEKDDFLWRVGGSVVTDYSVVIPANGENWIEAKQKRIGAFVSFTDEMGTPIIFEPMKEYCVLGDKTTVGDLLMTCGIPDGEYAWELCYVNVNGETVSTQVALTDEVQFVYTPDFDSYGFYRVELYGKTSSLRIEYSAWLADKGDVWGSLSYSESVTVGQFLADTNLGITIDDVFVTVNYQDYGEGVEDASYEISSPCSVTISEKRPYVQVRAFNENGERTTKYLFMPSGEYTVGQAVLDAGFNYEDFFWEIQRYNNNNMYTETISVTDRNFLLVNDDEIIAKRIESVQVWFDCYEYGWVEVGDGGASATYGVDAKWDNPQMFFSGDVGQYFIFEGWSFEKREMGDFSDVEIITSLSQIFAKGQEMITVFPVFTPNYESLSGWWSFNMDGNPAYVNILNESELLLVSTQIEGVSNFTVSLQFGQIRVTLDGGNIGYTSFELYTYSSRPVTPIVKIVTEYEDGTVDAVLFEGEQEFRNFLTYEGYTLKSFTLDGVEVGTDELLADAYYVAVFSYKE